MSSDLLPSCEAALRGVASHEPKGAGAGFSRGSEGSLDGLRHASSVTDLDLAGLGLLGERDRKHAALVRGGDVVTVHPFAEEELTAELPLARSATWT